MKKKQTEIIEYINSLKGHQGYIQYSDRPIQDIWTSESNIVCKPEKGFVYEAHFCNGTNSISIKQINDSWFIDETNISDIPKEDIETYHAIGGRKVKMAQVWLEEVDELCENMKVKKLKKVVFAGFEGDKK